MNIHFYAHYIKHLGWKYVCPICGYHQSSLRPIHLKDHELCHLHIVGGGARPCYCWQCNSTDRERLIYLYCKNTLNLFPKNETTAPKTKLLHIAPERNLSQCFLNQNNIEYIAGDYFMKGYSYPDYCRHMDITNLSLQDDTFDVVICCHVLEHIVDEKKALSELHRVLKPNGIAILQVPLCPENQTTLENPNATDEERAINYGQWDHVRLYGLDYKNRLAQSGFHVEVVQPNPKYAKYGVNPEECLYIAKKITQLLI